MNKNNQNPWDGRRPSLERWWESDNSQNNEIPKKMPTSPKVLENTKKWINRSLQRPNENTVIKKCIAKKSDTPEICKIKPCLCMKLKSVIRANTNSLTNDVCSLYNRWLCGPLNTDLEFHDALLTLIGLLKNIIKDLNGVNGNHSKLESLIKRYTECQDKYQILLMQLNQASYGELTQEKCSNVPMT